MTWGICTLVHWNTMCTIKKIIVSIHGRNRTAVVTVPADHELSALILSLHTSVVCLKLFGKHVCFQKKWSTHKHWITEQLLTLTNNPRSVWSETRSTLQISRNHGAATGLKFGDMLHKFSPSNAEVWVWKFGQNSLLVKSVKLCKAPFPSYQSCG